MEVGIVYALVYMVLLVSSVRIESAITQEVMYDRAVGWKVRVLEVMKICCL
jgi:hypothetical protein